MRNQRILTILFSLFLILAFIFLHQEAEDFAYSECTWTQDILLTEVDGEFSNQPDIASEGRYVHLVWQDTRDGDSEIYYRQRSGGSWGAETRLTTNSGLSWSPCIARGPDGRLHVAWVDSRTGDHEIYLAADPEHTISESNESNNEASMIHAIIIFESNENINETSKSLTVSSSGNIAYVSSIDVTLFNQWPFYRASALITIMDDNKNPIVGATVYGSWSGLHTGDVNSVTDENGQVTLNSGKVRDRGTFTFSVTNVVKTDWTYDPTHNGVTYNSITCPYVYVYRARVS